MLKDSGWLSGKIILKIVQQNIRSDLRCLPPETLDLAWQDGQDKTDF